MAGVPNPRLKILRGSQEIREIEIRDHEELVVGRTSQCDLVIAHASVSRMHARIFRDGTRVFVEDLGSGNGTYLDGEKILRVTDLADGQSLRMGQKSLHTPTILRFSDPSAQLLRDMGLLAETSPTEPALPPTEPAPLAVIPQEDSDRTTQPPSEWSDSASLEPATDALGEEPLEGEELEEEDPPPPPRPKPFFLKPLFLLSTIAGVVVFLLFAFWVGQFFRPSRTLWTTVNLSPAEVGPETELTLRSTDIYPSDSISVIVGGQEIEEFTLEPGRLNLVIPEFPKKPAGRSDLPLLIRNGDLDIFASTLAYVVRPQIESLVPEEAVVGGELAIRGRGFSNRKNEVQVWFGDEPAEVRSSSREEIVVSIPVLTRDRSRRMPLKIRVGTWESTFSEMVKISPRVEIPIDWTFQADWVASRSAWRIQGPFGTVFYLDKPKGSGETPPQAVLTVLDDLHQFFTDASTDPEIGLRVSVSGQRYRLRTTGEAKSRTILEWNTNDLETTAGLVKNEVTPDMLSYWLAGVFNDFITVFCHGKTLEQPPGALPHIVALNKLVDINVETGGQGRPELADFDRLDLEDQQPIANAFFEVPPSFGSLTGRWFATLSDIFYEEGNNEILLQLDLKQRGRRITGTAKIKIKSESMELGFPNGSINGRVEPGVPPKVTLDVSLKRPFGKLHLEATADGRTVTGKFTSSLSKNRGDWSATRFR